MRSKSVDFNSWLELQMWRSDGAPAAHGTFGLIAINLKLKKGLMQQGHYALNTSGIDVSTTAQEILQAGDEDVLQKQMTELIKRYTYMSCFEYITSTRTKQLTTFLITETGAKSSKRTYPAPTGTGSLPFTSSRLRPSSSRTSITELLRSSIPAVWQSSMNMT